METLNVTFGNPCENIIEYLIQQGKLFNFQRNYSKSACLYKTYEIAYRAGYNKQAGRRYFINRIINEQA